MAVVTELPRRITELLPKDLVWTIHLKCGRLERGIREYTERSLKRYLDEQEDLEESTTPVSPHWVEMELVEFSAEISSRIYRRFDEFCRAKNRRMDLALCHALLGELFSKLKDRQPLEARPEPKPTRQPRGNVSHLPIGMLRTSRSQRRPGQGSPRKKK